MSKRSGKGIPDFAIVTPPPPQREAAALIEKPKETEKKRPTAERSAPKRTTKKKAPVKTVSTNLQKPATSGSVQLNFRVPAEVRRQFKIEAIDRGLSAHDFFMTMYQFWQENNP